MKKNKGADNSCATVKSELELQHITSYVNNLSADSLKFALTQLVAYPESRDFFLNAVREWVKFYSFPIKNKR